MVEILMKGSWLMIPLLVCSALAVAVIIDRGIAFYKHQKLDTRALRSRVLALLHRGKVDEAARLCADTPSPVSAVMLAGLQSYGKHKALTHQPQMLAAAMEKAMDDYAQHAIAAVEKRLGVLVTVGNVAPLLGMTGTVTGMIKSFSELAAAGSVAGSERVALGISEALITTAAGLIIALIAILPHQYFTSMANRIDLEIEEASTEMLDHVATRVEASPAARDRTDPGEAEAPGVAAPVS